MQYAAHIYLWTKCWTDHEVGLFAHVRSLGVDLLEISIGDDVIFDVALTKRAAADAGMGSMNARVSCGRTGAKADRCYGRGRGACWGGRMPR